MLASEKEGKMNKSHYAHQFGLPEDQIRMFHELTPAQIEEVRQQFTAGLINVENYVYAVKRAGGLVWRRERRNPLLERGTA